MDETVLIVIQVIAQTSIALAVAYITWSIIRGLTCRDYSEGEKHHD